MRRPWTGRRPVPTWPLTFLWGLSLLLQVSTLSADDAAKPDSAPVREFRGETAEENTTAVPQAVIGAAQAYEDAWKALGLKESPGVVDFEKEVIFLATTRGSRIQLRCRDEGEGKLQVMAIATRDIRPGLRYLIGVFLKKDWQEVNGTSIP